MQRKKGKRRRKDTFSGGRGSTPFAYSRADLPKGFSGNAQFAADGCLKEHGKLLLSINDDELLKMIDLRDSGEDPEDFLLEKLEDILMTTGK